MKAPELFSPLRRLTMALSSIITVCLGIVGTASSVSASETANNPLEAILTCNSRTAIIADLKNGYSEQPIAMGVTNAGTVMELWTTTEGNTWTLIVTLANGSSCVVGAGDDWTNLQKTAKGKIL